jgi:acetate---CoA ligase (ADP-forming)
LKNNITRTNEETVKSISSLLNPKSVVILGASAKPGSGARNIMKTLNLNGYEGEIYLVGRNSGDINGIEIITDMSLLPSNVDLGILAIPAASVYDTIVDLKTAGVKTAVCLSSGFAEMGEEGLALQNKIGTFAYENNIRLIGPNCLGYFNYVNNFHLVLVDLPKQVAFDTTTGSKGVAIVTQSGGIGLFIGQSLGKRAVPTTYSITIGNQADIELSDLIDFFIEDEHTGAIAVYAEEIKNPEKLMAAVKRANTVNKNVILMHSGRSEASRAITQSHTGSLTGDYSLMKTKLVNAGVAMVDSLDELINLSELLLRFPNPVLGEVGLMTHSGAVCAIASDQFEDNNLVMASLSSDIENKLKEIIPEYLPARNPFDVGVEAAKNPSLVGNGLELLLSEPKIGSTIVILPTDQDLNTKIKFLEGFIESTKRHPNKPSIYVPLDESNIFEPEFMELTQKEGVVIGKSMESAIKTLGNLNKLCINRAKQKRETEDRKLDIISTFESGNVAEYKSKEVMKQLNIPIPRGALAASIDEAIKIANDISYPVVLKAQSNKLAHKTDAGGVILNIKSDDELKKSFTKMNESIKINTGIILDGILIEPMEKLGAEIVIGARRDPQWGAVVLVGLGGIWIEILKDVCLITPDLGEDAIIDAISSLKSSALLKGARGSEPVDLRAIAQTVIKIADLISSNERIAEVEINPLIAKPDGVVALDALIVIN